MTKIKYDSNIMNLITIFESMTGAKVKDCIAGEKLIFVIEENDMAKAIGRNGISIRRVENALKKKIKLVEFSSDVINFVKNLVHPIDILDIKEENGIITIHGKDVNTKAMLIGRDRKNINHFSEIVKRYFDVKELKVV